MLICVHPSSISKSIIKGELKTHKTMFKSCDIDYILYLSLFNVYFPSHSGFPKTSSQLFFIFSACHFLMVQQTLLLFAIF